MDLSNIHTVAVLGFLLALAFGAVGNYTNFCTMGAVSDWVNMEDKGRLRAWFLAIGIAILGAQTLHLGGYVDLGKSIYLSANFGWLGHLLGGFLFGVGMTLGGGCGQRTLVRIGNGNLKSLVAMLMLGFFAYMTLRGLLALVRIDYVETTNIDLSEQGLVNQGIDTALLGITNLSNGALVRGMVAAVMGLGFVFFAIKDAAFRRNFKNMLAGISIGLFIVAAWYITGHVGFNEFEPVPVESFTFVAPVGETLQYLMTFTGSTIKFGIAAVLGVIAGSFLFGLLSGRFRIETFNARQDMINHMFGGALMGFGGVLSLGCTIGQGVTGMSTLAMGPVLTLGMIIFGSALTMKVQSYMMDELGFLAALRSSLADMRLFPLGKSTT